MSRIGKAVLTIKDSSNIQLIEYDYDSKRMLIEFGSIKNGESLKESKLYKYENVEKDDFEKVIYAESVGSYVNTVLIKKYKGWTNEDYSQ